MPDSDFDECRDPIFTQTFFTLIYIYIYIYPCPVLQGGEKYTQHHYMDDHIWEYIWMRFWQRNVKEEGRVRNKSMERAEAEERRERRRQKLASLGCWRRRNSEVEEPKKEKLMERTKAWNTEGSCSEKMTVGIGFPLTCLYGNWERHITAAKAVSNIENSNGVFFFFFSLFLASSSSMSETNCRSGFLLSWMYLYFQIKRGIQSKVYILLVFSSK